MNICILYYIENTSLKYLNWHDGFTKSIELLSNKYNIDMINVYDNTNINFDKYNLIFFKESFNGKIYNKYKNNLKKKSLGLFISSSNIIPTDNVLKIYDILFYETHWYYNYAKLHRHKNSIHAFGIDTDIMKKIDIQKEYDVIFVGNICNYKRPLKLLSIPGKKICLGFQSDKAIVKILKDNNVEIKDFVTYQELSSYYNKSKLAYIPCEIHGGGERAVLEARSCNIEVKIENDNNKLKELINSQIYSSKYYAKQIEKGIIFHILNNINNYTYENILSNLKYINLNVLEIGGMDGKTFDPLYNNLSNKWNVTILEPIYFQFKKLENNYKNRKNVFLINKALNYHNKKEYMYTINEKSLINNNVPLWANGISSFYNNRNSLGEEYWKTRGIVHQKNNLNYNSIRPHINKIEVECITISEINLENIHILQSDTEGFDYNVIKIVLSKYKPFIIFFEWNNLPNDELDKLKILLSDYKTIYYKQDALSILKNT